MNLLQRISAKRAHGPARPARVRRSLPILLGVLLACAAVPSPAAAAVALSPERYAALDALFTSALPFDRARQSAKQLAAARSACRALDAADPLLAAIRRSCRVELRALKSMDAFGGCRTGLGCLRTARAARIDMSEILSLARRTNAAIDAASLMPSCRRALRAKKHELRLATRARDMLMLFQRAGTTGSRTLFVRLDREADAVGRLSAAQPSAARERKVFRSACAPSPAAAVAVAVAPA